MKEMLRLIKNLLSKRERKSLKQFKQEVTQFISETEESLQIQLSSTKLFFHYVNDMLLLGQLKSSNQLIKNCSNFNIRDIVKEIIDIQQDKADSQGINLKC